MQRILIQLDGSLLWQILAEADSAMLQRLEELLRILADQTQAETPLVAYCTEADWAWLRHQIQTHYSFDLAEELLLRLDVLCLCPPDASEPVYAVVTDAASAAGLSLEEFLDLYQVMHSLELLYRELPEAQPQFTWTGPELTVQQARVLLVSLALLLALLPHLTTLQKLALGRAEAETAESPIKLLSNLTQTTHSWIEQMALQVRPTQESGQPLVLTQPNPAIAPAPGSDPVSLNPIAVSPFGPDPIGRLSPLIQPLSQAMLAALPDATPDQVDLAVRPSTQPSPVTSEPPAKLPVSTLQLLPPEPLVSPQPISPPQPLAPPRPTPAPPVPAAPQQANPPGLADSRPADSTVALQNHDQILGDRASVGLPEQTDPLLVASRPMAADSESRELQSEEPLGQSSRPITVSQFEQLGQAPLITLPSPLDPGQIGLLAAQSIV